MAPLHSSLGNKSETNSASKKKKIRCLSVFLLLLTKYLKLGNAHNMALFWFSLLLDTSQSLAESVPILVSKGLDTYCKV